MIKNRIELVEYFRDQGFKRGAEIGVADGRYAEILCKTIPDLEYWGIDPWAEYDGNWRTTDEQKVARQRAIERLRPFPNATLIKATSFNAYAGNVELSQYNEPELIPYKIPNDLDFVFIDGAHDFNNVMLDMLLWVNKVKSGGIVSGHDYYKFRTGNVIEAVDAFVKANGLELNIIPEATKVHHDDRVPCWWFVKP